VTIKTPAIEDTRLADCALAVKGARFRREERMEIGGTKGRRRSNQRWITTFAAALCGAHALACGNAESARAQRAGRAGESSSLAGSTTAGGAASGSGGNGSIGAGNGGATSSAGAPNGGAEGSEPRIEPQPTRQQDDFTIACWTVSPGIATGREETDGALCFGLSYGSAFQCVTSADGISTCTSDSRQYVVVWTRDDTAKYAAPSGLVGQIYDEVGGTYLGVVYRNRDDNYAVELDGSEIDLCRGDVSDYCKWIYQRH